MLIQLLGGTGRLARAEKGNVLEASVVVIRSLKRYRKVFVFIYFLQVVNSLLAAIY